MRNLLLLGIVGLIVGAGGRVAWNKAVTGPSVDEPFFATIEGRLPTDIEREGERFAGLVVSASDVLTCEDLGRQLREFERQELEPNGLPLDVWVYDDSIGAVAEFIALERLNVRAIRSIDPTSLLGRSPLTPAVFVARADGSFEGIAYENRTRLVRSISFVDLVDVGRIVEERHVRH